eukprot:SAG11_NODE_360_length_10188_cov_25.643671_8_plen_513_part_00
MGAEVSCQTSPNAGDKPEGDDLDSESDEEESLNPRLAGLISHHVAVHAVTANDISDDSDEEQPPPADDPAEPVEDAAEAEAELTGPELEETYEPEDDPAEPVEDAADVEAELTGSVLEETYEPEVELRLALEEQVPEAFNAASTFTAADLPVGSAQPSSKRGSVTGSMRSSVATSSASKQANAKAIPSVAADKEAGAETDVDAAAQAGAGGTSQVEAGAGAAAGIEVDEAGAGAGAEASEAGAEAGAEASAEAVAEVGAEAKVDGGVDGEAGAEAEPGIDTDRLTSMREDAAQIQHGSEPATDKTVVGLAEEGASGEEVAKPTPEDVDEYEYGSYYSEEGHPPVADATVHDPTAIAEPAEDKAVEETSNVDIVKRSPSIKLDTMDTERLAKIRAAAQAVSVNKPKPDGHELSELISGRKSLTTSDGELQGVVRSIIKDFYKKQTLGLAEAERPVVIDFEALRTIFAKLEDVPINEAHLQALYMKLREDEARGEGGAGIGAKTFVGFYAEMAR